MTYPDDTQVWAVTLVERLTDFVAKAGYYNAEALKLARQKIGEERAWASSSDEVAERDFLVAAERFLARKALEYDPAIHLEITGPEGEILEGGPDLRRPEVRGDSERRPGSYCSECGLSQYDTPSGLTCKNSHGGADSINADEAFDLRARLRGQQSERERRYKR